EIVGVDSSADMLAKARDRAPLKVRFERHDIAQWRPASPPDVVYSNAALHWLDDHGTLFPRLLAALAPGGTLAVQMPRNHRAPSHTCMVEAANAGDWRAALAPILRTDPVHEPEFYYDALAPLAAAVDIWQTEYVHVLSGDDPVVEWTKGSALKPLLDAIDGRAREEFLAAYRARIARAYPRRPDGTTLFPFRRLFVVARRA
ncbi:MAG: methyltransferase domain-containing protein, partial [Alphaproteobacteria bacterium]